MADEEDPRERFRVLPEPVRLGQTFAVHDMSTAAAVGMLGTGVFLAPDGAGGDGGSD
ncbi:hypothetical protein NUM3379_16170 [Kineococcus sp. NUM-3379]